MAQEVDQHKLGAACMSVELVLLRMSLLSMLWRSNSGLEWASNTDQTNKSMCSTRSICLLRHSKILNDWHDLVGWQTNDLEGCVKSLALSKGPGSIFWT